MTDNGNLCETILTANRLDDGSVVWMTADLGWSKDRLAAASFAGVTRATALAVGAADVARQRIVGVYEIQLDGIQDLSARETIRAAGGPSITPPADRLEDIIHV